MPLPQATRTTRATRPVTDENTAAPITRAKAANLTVDEVNMPVKGALQAKKVANTTTAAGLRKRAALGDVSNMAKTDAVEGKKVAGKVGLVSKASAGVQKATARTATRPALATKETKKAAAPVEAKPARSGSGAATVGKKRTYSTKHSVVAEKDVEQPAAKRSKESPAVEAPQEVFPDVDDDDLDDPLMVAEYATEIFEYLHELEIKSIPNHNYMNHQDDLEWKTRGILVDWLIEVHTRFHLLPETLFLAVNIVDRFLSEKVVQLDNFQLVGITAMFIASKYEEVLSPHVENFKRITDDGFSESEILSAERFVLSTLEYDLSYPNPMNFLRRVSKADNYDIQSRTVGKYLMEIALLDHRFMKFPPSQIAAAAMYLARLMLDRGVWDKTLAHYSTYTEEEVEPIVHLMVDYLARPVVHEAFFKKYASKKFLKASILSRQWAKKNAELFGIVDTEVSLYML
ncbi:Putative G2 mitotic-specific cyclin-b [[Torrubiella] hemipterigena]|uniref:Putative G2 mitotic-specific cyclin-b n=1 Tax=[Torrubiella] hemipterigena TaxID=1531966 RepID=A0A0A1TAD3_9HYPO|nr:Putative G2 mitotic-specific cyclin-b [[Torrubiella] hemipterigena]